MIKSNIDVYGVQLYIRTQIANYKRALIETYKFVGEGFVRDARQKTSEQGGFRDVTGNLRSSIGFIVIEDGKQREAFFQEGDNGTDRQTGKETGKTFAEEIAKKYPQGIALIVVAGMEYASAVESRGKDVITGSSLGIEARLRNLLSRV